jgi:predicted MFS family arabinose efflux permease
VLPTMIGLTILNGFVGYLVVGREVKREKVTAYPKTIVLSIMMICGFTVLLLTFLFPFLKVYSWHALPILVCMVFGIAVFMTGMIYELRFIQWFSLSWWAGAILMALFDGEFRFLIMIGAIIFGWIVPGLILNQKYKNRSK